MPTGFPPDKPVLWHVIDVNSMSAKLVLDIWREDVVLSMEFCDCNIEKKRVLY